MFFKGSRYENTRGFDPAPDGTEVFEGNRPREIGSATAVVEHQVRAGDRPDLLARHYYNNDRLWWRIVDANPSFIFAADMVSPEREGEIILIPKARE